MHMECILKQIRINFGIVRKVSSLLNKNALMMLTTLSYKAISHTAFLFGILEIYYDS